MKFKVKSLVVALSLTAVSNFAMANTDLDNESYAIGASMGKYLNGQITVQKEFGIDANLDQVIAGFADALQGNNKLDNEALIDALNARAKVLNDRKQERQAALLKETSQEAREYMEQNAEKDGVMTTESGLQYEVLVAGDGRKPNPEDAVTVHYKGTLLDGSVFEDTHGGEPKELGLINVIDGWNEGIQLMPVGSTYRFTIPAKLAYGDQGMGAIPGGSAIIFDIELIDAKKPGKGHGGMGMGMGMNMNMGMGAAGTAAH
ncbi:FKBP-type peptidyl-prolyl cis-trans isomerase [Ferrimonas aestuarii]|uniref:Peptidyl-prolyl cis-trans isomerase n=1 Tax=Ferrimonas aestuarii TaxID=2569539 RepID=A0A4U1BFR4_9GAMM|nr:FKBP-type peptidyl-prolyl cis-trans isomerase [Ferrimonas aestuarii]TKB50151.1 FKBP-type peptidyl-prolyl cis-trans isomerase [Ferrimonas aestuarii]